MSGPPVAHGDELRFYYGGRTSRHRPYKQSDTQPGGATGLATILRDRFVSAEASFDGGTLTTKPITFEGTQFKINGNAAFGKLEIKFLDTSGKPIPGYQATIEGTDSVDISVEFDKPLGALRSTATQVEFKLYNAQLYSFWVQ